MEDVSKYDLKINFIIKKHFLFTQPFVNRYKPEIKAIIEAKNFYSVLTNPKFDLSKENLNLDQETRLSNYDILGGIDGLCMALKAHGVKPDFKFFNTLLLVRKKIFF